MVARLICRLNLEYIGTSNILSQMLYFFISFIIMFNEKTRWFCYTLVILSVASELIPIQVNAIALAATCSALVALIAMDVVHRMKAPKAAVAKH